VWREEALKLRARFDEHKNERNVRTAVALLEEGERLFEMQKHPEPYISPEAPDGSKWERNMPPPLHVLEMTPEEEKWFREASQW
jgi:NADH dehydrogenase (ubiquinone) 1 beta subcomplex subunit 9